MRTATLDSSKLFFFYRLRRLIVLLDGDRVSAGAEDLVEVSSLHFIQGPMDERTVEAWEKVMEDIRGHVSFAVVGNEESFSLGGIWEE